MRMRYIVQAIACINQDKAVSCGLNQEAMTNEPSSYGDTASIEQSAAQRAISAAV
jgi:hypothetical protein